MLHKIAQQVVKRALNLARNNLDVSNLTLVTSTNNRAVNNVESLLAEQFPPSTFFYLAGGSSELITTRVIPQLTTALDWLQTAEFKESEWLAIKQKLLGAEDEYLSYQQQDEYYQQQKAIEQKLLAECEAEIQALSQQLETFKSKLQQPEALTEKDNYAQFPEAVFNRVKRKLETAWDSLTPSYQNKTRHKSPQFSNPESPYQSSIANQDENNITSSQGNLNGNAITSNQENFNENSITSTQRNFNENDVTFNQEQFNENGVTSSQGEFNRNNITSNERKLNLNSVTSSQEKLNENSIIPSKSTKNLSWYQRLWLSLKSIWRWLTGKTDERIISRLNQSIREDVALTKNTPFPLELILNRKHLEYWLSYVSEHLIAYQQWQQQQLSTNKPTKLEILKQQLEEKKQQQQSLTKQLATYPAENFDDRFYKDYHSLQIRLFELARQFQLQEALRRKSESSTAISTYIEFLSSDSRAYGKLARDGHQIYRDLCLLFPVFLSTLHSLRNLFPYPDNGCIDQLIVEEAGQIPLHQVFSALVRSREALIVGDPLQLEPVITLSDQAREKYLEKAFLSRRLTEMDYERFSPTVISAYHRAAGVSGELNDEGLGIMLLEHYRCVPVIANFCRNLCYSSMKIETKAQPSLLGANLIAYHIAGQQTQHINQAEIEMVAKIIEELKSAGYCFNNSDSNKTIGIISPYRRQADALSKYLQTRYQDFPGGAIGTVHTFQGGEKSVIILSTRQCSVKDSLWFINRRPNLLNVAVSRAKELFILVGNLERLSEGGYTKQLVEYIKQWGEIRK